MRRLLTTLAMAFSAVLLGMAVLGVWNGVYRLPEAIYLVAIPAVMLAITAYTARAARNPRLTPGVLTGGSLLATFATLMWIGVLGAGV